MGLSDGFSKKAKAGPEVIQQALEGGQVLIRHDERTAAPLEVDEVSPGISNHLPREVALRDTGSRKCDSALRVGQQGPGGDLVPMVNVHRDRRRRGAACGRLGGSGLLRA